MGSWAFASSHLPSVVVDELDVLGAGVRPAEADPELVVDPDRVVAGSVALELLESVPRWESEVLETFGRVQLSKLALGHPLDVRPQAGDPMASPDLLRGRVREGLDHRLDSNA
jgi:hypothetical protein